MNDLLVSPEFWEENIKTEIFNVVQDFLTDNSLTRKDFADKVGVSKGYISQVLNGDSDHRLSKLVALALNAKKAPYIYLKDIDEVLQQSELGNSVFIDFKELEKKASKCDSYDKSIQNVSNFFSKKRNKALIRTTPRVNLKNHFGTNKSVKHSTIDKADNYTSNKQMINAA